MALPPTSNAGTVYFNRNQCRSFEQQITTALTKLSAGPAPATGFPCSEVFIKHNMGGGMLYIYDRAELHTSGVPEDECRWALSAGESFTFRGLTNIDQVSAKASTGVATIHYRTQFYSSNVSTS
tara:strand:- start:34 stop:405 length:372 start_codon:yes stop_codon:yes gene_type:complete